MATDSRDGGDNSMENLSMEDSRIPKISNKAKRPSGLEILAEAAMFSQKQDTEKNSTENTKTHQNTQNAQNTQNTKNTQNTQNSQNSQNSQNQSNSPQKVQKHSKKQDSNMPQAGTQLDTLDVIQNLVKNSSKNVAELLTELNMTPEVFEYVLKQIQKREDEKRSQ